MGVVLYALLGLFCFASGVFLEHYLGPRPKLDTDELFQAIELIDDYCKCDDKLVVAILRNELNIWIEYQGAMPISKELNEIIETVLNKEYE